MTFVVGKSYRFYMKNDTDKINFDAVFLGGKDPIEFKSSDGYVYKYYELVYVKPNNDEVFLK